MTPDHLNTYVAQTHTLSELNAHGDVKTPRTQYQLPDPTSSKVSYACRHNGHRHCSMLACTCACHAIEERRPER